LVDQRSLLDTATAGARAAGGLLLERFGGPAEGVSTKSTPTDLVSDADRDSESLLIDLIARSRPDDGVLSEEGGGRESSSGLRWVIDPLDGTVNYLFGIPQWCVSVAVEDDEGWVAGAVFDPNRDEMFSATRGGGAHLNDERISVSDRADLATALIGTGFSYDVRVREVQAQVAARTLTRVRDIRRAGSAALDLAWVACGRLDGMYEADMNAWDRAAGELLITEAGGVISPLAPPFGDSQGLVASGPRLHDGLRALVLE